MWPTNLGSCTRLLRTANRSEQFCSRGLSEARLPSSIQLKVRLLILRGTISDAAGDRPLTGKALWVEGARIKAIGSEDELRVSPGAQRIDARGKFVIPGLMNANVHLFSASSFERLVRHLG